jgi:hypothetical protein
MTHSVIGVAHGVAVRERFIPESRRKGKPVVVASREGSKCPGKPAIIEAPHAPGGREGIMASLADKGLPGSQTTMKNKAGNELKVDLCLQDG